MSKQLYRSHRMFGYEIARTKTSDDTELVILQTAPHKQDVSPAHLLMPVSDDEALFEARIRLHDAIDYARFIGISLETLRTACEEAIELHKTP